MQILLAARVPVNGSVLQNADLQLDDSAIDIDLTKRATPEELIRRATPLSAVRV